MAEVIENSSCHLTDSDLKAMAVYLRKTNGGEVFMPDFADILTDEQVVSLSNYLL